MSVQADSHEFESLIETPAHGGGTSEIGAIFSIVCTLLGSGVLALPSALANGGWFAAALIIMCSFLCNFTAKKLVGCMRMGDGRMLATYVDIGQEAFGTPGKIFVAVLQCVTLFGVCTIYLVLIGGNLATILFVDTLTSHDWVLISAAILIPISWLKTMKEVSIVAIFGALASIFVGLVVIVEGIKQYAHHHDEATHDWILWSKKSPVSSTNLQLPVAFNTIVFSFGGHSVVPTIAYSMAKPERFNFVANVAYTIIGLTYTSVAIAGYLGYGDAIHGNVLEDLWPVGIDKKPTSAIVIIAYATITAHVMMAYPLPMNPLNIYIERALNFDAITSPATEWTLRIILRTFVVSLTVFTALVVPYFGDLLSLVSALTLMAIVFILPVVFFAKLKRNRVLPWEWPLFAFCVILGLFGFGVGMYYGIKDLKDDIQNNGNPFDNFFKPK